MLYCFSQARIQLAQEKQKKDYAARKNKGVKTFQFAVGDQVLRRNMIKKGRKGSRLETDWLGPYVITARHAKGTVSLTKDGKDLKTRVNEIQLKPYKQRRSRCVSSHVIKLNEKIITHKIGIIKSILLL